MMKFMSITFWGLALLALSTFGGIASAQTPNTQGARQSRPAPPSQASVPNEAVLARLVWSTMIALDNANRTENYSVLYALGSPTFKEQNTPQQLAQSFSALRQNRIDIGRTIFLAPTYYIPPAILSDGSLRLRGGFDNSQKSIRFDLIFSNQGGGWQIKALSVVETSASAPK